MEPTAYDIRREVEALRDLRRRSTTPGALTLDPDLPNQSPPSPRSPDAASSSSSSRPPDPAPAAQQPSDDPFHLFWVPASLHPEIAPAEFRAFLKEHARNPSSDDDHANLTRSASNASTTPSALGRKKSMLSRQYEPSENDANVESSVVPLRRNRSIFSSNQNQGPQLTISDLQKLEELAEEASTSDDPANLRNILRRSLSLNLSPLALDDADLGDEADQPIVVAPPGQFLRRTARTRIRKPGLPGDGNGHRFGERRRGPSARSATSPMLNRTSSDVSSSDHGESVESATLRHRTTFSDDGPHERPDSFSEEALIYDAYARDEEDDDIPPPLPPVLITSSPPPTIIEFTDIPPQPEAPPQQEPPPPPPPEPQPTLLEALSPVIYQPQPTRLLSPSPSDTPAPLSRTPSPSDSQHDTYSPSGTPTNSPPASSFLSTSPSPRKEKDKKGLFGKWGSDKEKEKSGKAGKKERERLEKERREKEQREKDSGFFGSLFGSKKKHEAPPETSSSQGGREAAQALLGPSQRAPKSPGPPSPGMGGMPGVMGPGGVNNYSRYPIHVERAIYRLSHIKLANPRRPLYEQVLISNLMFWYLGVINKAQAGAQAEQAAQAAAAAQPAGGANGQAPGPPEGEKERVERERVEREAAAAAQERAEQERVERERVEREREREQRERAEREQWEQEKKKRDASPRRGALTKAVPPGAPQQRRAEMPVKGPQYEQQHRSMEKEYAGYNGNGPRSSTASGSGQMYPRQAQSPTSPKFNQQPSSPQPQDQHYYYSPGESMQQQQQRLPPGAMAPVDSSTWVVGQPPGRKHANSSPPPMSNQVAPHRRSRSPPPPSMNQQPMPVYNPDGAQGGARLGGRSLSATAVPSQPAPPPMNGKIRKGQSAYAGGAPANGRRSSPANGASAGGGGEEEDVPLAVWQRQQQRR